MEDNVKIYYTDETYVIVFSQVAFTEWKDQDHLAVHMIGGKTAHIKDFDSERFYHEHMVWLQEDEPSINDLLEAEE